MDGSRFDHLVRSLTASRRWLMSSALAGVAGWAGIATADAKKKRKRKDKKKPKPNAFGCFNVGVACKSEDQCCSGICAGKKGKRTCKAHDVSTCSAGDQLGICGGTSAGCTTSAGVQGACATTTGNAGYCAASVVCYPCQTDADCQNAEGGALGPNAACLQCAGCMATGGTVCAAPFFPAEVNQKGRFSELRMARSRALRP
jgi:hypothetical protein